MKKGTMRTMGFTKSVTITFLSNLVLFFLSIVSTTILSRVLGPNGKGIVDVANNFLSFAVIILGMGFASSNVFFLGKKRENVNGIFGNNILIAILAMVVLIPFYFLQIHFHFKFLQGDNQLSDASYSPNCSLNYL